MLCLFEKYAIDSSRTLIFLIGDGLFKYLTIQATAALISSAMKSERPIINGWTQSLTFSPHKSST